MKRFIITIITFLVLASAVSAVEWKKVKTEVVSDHDYYEWILDMSNQTLIEYPNEETKLVMSVNKWISDQIVIEYYIADYSKEIEAEKAKQRTAAVLDGITAFLYNTRRVLQNAGNAYGF